MYYPNTEIDTRTYSILSKNIWYLLVSATDSHHYQMAGDDNSTDTPSLTYGEVMNAVGRHSANMTSLHAGKQLQPGQA